MAKRRDYTSEEIDLSLAAFAVEGGREKQTKKLLAAASLSVPFSTLRNWAYNVHADRYQQVKREVEERVGVHLADDFHRLARTSTELSDDILRRIRENLERKDKEFKEADEKLRAAEAELVDINTLIDLDQREIAAAIELPDVDSLIEEILSNPGDLELPKEKVAKLNGAYKRRSDIVAKIEGAWKRRAGAEVTFKELAKLLHESAVMGGISTEKLQLLTGQATDRVEHSFPEVQRALEAKGIRLLVGQGQSRPPVIEAKATPVLEAGDG